MIKELTNIYQVQLLDNRSSVVEFAGEFSTFREAEAKVKELKSGGDYSGNFYRPLFWKIVDIRDGGTILSGTLEVKNNGS